MRRLLFRIVLLTLLSCPPVWEAMAAVVALRQGMGGGSPPPDDYKYPENDGPPVSNGEGPLSDR